MKRNTIDNVFGLREDARRYSRVKCTGGEAGWA